MTGSYRYASKVRVTPALEGDDSILMFAGKVDDGAEMVREVEGEQERVTIEVIERFHTDERMTGEEVVEFGKRQDDDWSHPNARINRNLDVPPICGPKVDEHPEVDAYVHRTARDALCRVCDELAEYVITLPGDVVPLCKADYGGDDRR